MKFELKEYQEEATGRVLTGLRKGSSEYESDGEFTAVSLSAPTGAGKTVIAAAVIERVLFGDPAGNHEADPDAIFVWLTDDPSLNDQTRKKLLEASDRIQPNNLVTLDDGFDQLEFDKGRVYFLNIQKLAKTSNMVVKREGRRRHVLWETFNDTIKANGAHFYLVIDEAHRGTGRASREAQTIVQRLMNGDSSVLAAPVVLGISATPERFEESVRTGAQERVPRRVPVPVAAVRESGLIKDVLSISYPGEDQTMETMLVRQAVDNLRQMDEAWNAYTEAEGEPPVRPALVLQIPPAASPADVGILLDVMMDEWDVLKGRNAIAHALESHSTESFGEHPVPYVKPQDIQDHLEVRLVVFKEALTTGWDCPRAEVMVSLRTAKDDTYVAQLIGRMVRSPLARRIQSDERLNRVRLYLPRFDRDAVAAVKTKLERDEGGLPTDIEVNSVDAPRNRAIQAEAFATVEALPSYQVPGPVHSSQVARLHKLAALLVGDGLQAGAIGAADQFLIAVLESERSRLHDQGLLDELVRDAQTASVEVMEINAVNEVSIASETFTADTRDVNRLLAAARRKFRDGLADAYWGYRVTDQGDDPFDAKTLTIALSIEQSVVDKVESESEDRVRQWLDTHGDAIAMLSEDKKAKYAEVRAMARQPELVHPGLPLGPITMPGDDSVPAFKKHLYANASGDFRTRLGAWEKHVLDVESRRPDFVAWYRNPTGGQRALRVPFDTSSGYGKLYPDFLILHRDEDGLLKASIVDPHGHHLGDAGDKLRGLAAFATLHHEAFARVLSVIRDSHGDYRMLDLQDPTVRAALVGVNGQNEIEAVFSDHGATYG